MRAVAALRRRLRQSESASAMMSLVVFRSLALAANVLTGVLTGALLGPAGRGEQSALGLAPIFLGAVSTLGLHASLIYNVKADPTNKDRYLGNGLLLAFLAGVVATGVGWVIIPRWLAQYDAHVIHWAHVLLLITPLLVVSPLLTGALEAAGRFTVAGRVLYWQGISVLALLVIFWTLGVLSPLLAALAYFIPSVPAGLYFAWQVRQVTRPRLTSDPEITRRLLQYGLRFYGVDLFGTLSTYLDQIILVTLLRPAAVGIYLVALSLSRVLTVLQGAVATVLFPIVAARPRAGVVETVAATVRVTLALSLLLAIGLALAGPPVMLVAYGHAFAGSIVPFRVLLGEAVVSNAARILYQIYSGTGRPGTVTCIEATAVAVSFGLMLLIVPIYGATGASCCVFAASTVRLACAVGGIPLVLRLRVPRLLLVRSDLQEAPAP